MGVWGFGLGRALGKTIRISKLRISLRRLYGFIKTSVLCVPSTSFPYNTGSSFVRGKRGTCCSESTQKLKTDVFCIVVPLHFRPLAVAPTPLNSQTHRFCINISLFTLLECRIRFLSLDYTFFDFSASSVRRPYFTTCLHPL